MLGQNPKFLSGLEEVNVSERLMFNLSVLHLVQQVLKECEANRVLRTVLKQKILAGDEDIRSDESRGSIRAQGTVGHEGRNRIFFSNF